MLAQEAVVYQESHTSVIAEEDWSNVGFSISKADERHREEKGEQEIRGEKESREVKRTRGRRSKVSSTEVCVYVVCVCTCACVQYLIVCTPESSKVPPLSSLAIIVCR